MDTHNETTGLRASMDTPKAHEAMQYLTAFGWAVAAIEPHGVVAVFQAYGPALAFMHQTVAKVSPDVAVYLLKLSEHRVFATLAGKGAA